MIRLRAVTYFSTELASQPSVWRQAQAPHGRHSAPSFRPTGRRVGILGCGTSLYVAQAVAIYREHQGKGETDAFPGSEVPSGRPWEQVIAISRSGTTTEIIDAVHGASPGTAGARHRRRSAGSPLGEVLTEELDLPFADEQSVVQTRFATTVLTLLLGAYGWDVEASAQRAERYLTESLPDWAGDIQQFVFLGRGVGMALAHEAALKFREILATWSEAYATMEYRHGPISAINERSLVWILDDRGAVDRRSDPRHRRPPDPR